MACWRQRGSRFWDAVATSIRNSLVDNDDDGDNDNDNKMFTWCTLIAINV